MKTISESPALDLSGIAPAPVEAAANLFDLMHEADASAALAIAVAPIPGDGLAAAIRDRLKRAAAPRS